MRGSTVATAADELAQLRELARSRPNDPAIWSELAAIEFIGDGGDPELARSTIDHARELTPGSAELALLSGWEHRGRGRLDAALDDFIVAVTVARTSDDAVAPLIAEVGIDAVAGLRGGVANYDARAIPLLEAVLAEPARLGTMAVDGAAQQLIRHHRRRGEPAAAAAIAERLGCLREWRTVGPFGPYAMSSFDQMLPAESATTLAASYELGGGRGEEATRDADVWACTVTLSGGRLVGPGSTIAETTVRVAEAGMHLLTIDTSGSFKVYVDGELVSTVDRRSAWHAIFVHIPLELSAGEHRVRLKVTTRREGVSIGAILDRADRLGAGYDPTRGVEVPEADSYVSAALRALVLRGRGDSVGAREAGALLAGPNPSAFALMLLTDIVGSDPYLSGQRREELVEELTRRAAARDPQALNPALRLALSEQGSVESFQALGAVAERFGESPTVQLTWARLLAQRGEPFAAERAIRAVIERIPEQCSALSQLRRLLRQQGRVADNNALVENTMTCDATSTARLLLMRRQRSWPEARVELERLRPLRTEASMRGLELGLALASNQPEVVTRLRAEIEAENYEAWEPRLHRIDRMMAVGEASGALSLLEESVVEEPARMAPLRSLRRDLTGQGDLEAFRMDGPEIIERFEASGRSYEQGEVLVFDYMVTRVYPDGSSRHLVHQIFKIQSEESLERLGQLSLGGDILTLRSIKPDGQQLEPERIAGLDSIPLTNLAIGDYVEYEYVYHSGARADGGFLSGGWLFQSYDKPFDFSQIVVVFPEAMDLVVESRGPVPEAVEARADGLRRLTYTVHESAALVREPRTVPRPAVLPYLRFGVIASWEGYFRAVYDGQLDRDPYDPAAARQVAQILDGVGEAPWEVRAERLLRWVTQNIEASEGWAGLAPVMLAARQGHRTRVLRYLLGIAGIEAKLVLARNYGSREPGVLPEGRLYPAALLLVEPEGAEPVYLWGEERGAPFRHLPSSFYGQVGVVLEEGFREVTLPDPGLEVDRRAIEVDVQLGRGGAATISVVETSHGAQAVSWRTRIEQIPEADLERVMGEAYVPQTIPGGVMTSVAFEGLEDPEAPVVLRYTAEVASFGREAGGARRLPALFVSDLARALAPLPTRTTTESSALVASNVSVRVQSAGGGIQGPPDLELSGQGARYTRTSRTEGTAFILERSLRMQQGYVPVAQYADFARFCRSVTEAERAEVSVAR